MATLRGSLRAAARCQPRPACGRRRAAADRARGRGPLIPPIATLCSATPPSRCGLLLQINYLVNRTVEDGSYSPSGRSGAGVAVEDDAGSAARLGLRPLKMRRV